MTPRLIHPDALLWPQVSPWVEEQHRREREQAEAYAMAARIRRSARRASRRATAQ